MAGPPNLSYGQVPTAGQWNSYFATKQDALGYVPVNRAGDTMFGKLNILASSTVNAGINLATGTAPNSPLDGDLWTTNTGLFAQIAGNTIGPIRNGNVAGPLVSVANNIATFADVTGAVIKDSGASIGSLTPGSRQVIAGTGLTGGGALSSDVTVGLNSDSVASLSLADGSAQKGQNLHDLTDIGAAQDNIQIGAIFADVSTATSATIPSRNKRISLQFYDLSAAARTGGAQYRRESLANLSGFPALAYFRSADRFMPDGSVNNTNGGYWVNDEAVLRPAMMGALVNVSTFDSGPAAQAAIDLGNLLGRPTQLPIGTLYTAQTLHIYAQSVLYGYGKSQSFLKAKDGSGVASDGKGVLETYNFLSLIDTSTKFVTDAGMTWGFTLKGFCVDGNRQVNYGGVSGARFGGVGTGVWDGFGIRLYGRMYIMEDVGVRYCAGIGFYSECGNPTTPSPSDWYLNANNAQHGHIIDMHINQCSFDGFVFRGPGDIYVSDITTELCFYPDTTQYGILRNSLMFPSEGISGMVWADKTVTGGSAVSGCEIGNIHSHTHKNGYGVRFEGNVFCRIRCNILTSEGNLGQIKSRGIVLGQWNKVNTRNNNVGDGSLPDIDIESSRRLTIDDLENLSTSGNLGSTKLRIGSDGLNFGMINIVGGTAGHGVVIDTNVDHVTIDKLIVSDLRGTAQDGNVSRGLWTKSGTGTIYIGEALIRDNDCGWRNDSNGELVIANGRIEANLGTYPSAVPLDLATAPSLTSLKKCGFTTNDGTNTRFSLFSGNASVDPTSVTEQTITWTHNMWRTPSIHEVSWAYTTNGTNRPTLQYAEVITPSSTQLSMRVKFSVAGNGTSGGSAFTAKV